MRMSVSALAAAIGCMALIGGAAEARAGTAAGAGAKACASAKRQAACAKPSPKPAPKSPIAARPVMAPPLRPTPVALGAAGAEAAALQKGKSLFSSLGCGSCHTLAQAGAEGRVGPSFDGNANLDQAYVADRVANGAGMMPAFGGQLDRDDLAALAAYVVQAKAP